MNQPEKDLRPMLVDDIAEVMAVENRIYTFPWTEGIFRDCLRVGYSCWVYREKGELKAYSVMSVGAGEGHILTICVKPEAQGQGIGRMMMEHLLQLASRRQVMKVFLEVRPSNQVAIHLYQSMGFVEVGRRQGYYPAEDGREDALVMRRDFI